MTIKLCDRCGAKISTIPECNAVFPMFMAKRCDNLATGWVNIDLCQSCGTELDKWLSNVEEA